MAGAFRRDHDHVDTRRRLDAAEVDVEAVGEEERRARLEVREHVFRDDGRLVLIGEEHGDELRAAHRVRDLPHGEPRVLRGRP